jgi:hypothetical protein
MKLCSGYLKSSRCLAQRSFAASCTAIRLMLLVKGFKKPLGKVGVLFKHMNPSQGIAFNGNFGFQTICFEVGLQSVNQLRS